MPTTIFCRCHGGPVMTDEARAAIETAVCGLGGRVVIVDDLCGAVVSGSLAAAGISDVAGVTVVACHTRAVQGLLRVAGVESGPATRLVDVRGRSVETVIAELQGARCCERSEVVRIDTAAHAGWTPWYPVIDRARCRACGQCAGFCLFGVYESGSDGTVTVARPANCKTNCPACARICPEVAIMFPKCPEAPINGDVITDESAARAAVKVNIDKMLGENPYAALAERRRRAVEARARQSAREKAQ